MNVKLTTDTIAPSLRRLLAKAENAEPAMRAAATVVTSMARDAFTNEAVRPSAWAPLRPFTLARKAELGYGSKPLIASGVLARSPRTIETSRTHALVGSDRRVGDYSLAAIHQLGAPKAHVPPRPFFPFSAAGKATETVRRRVRDVLLRWLRK